MATATLGGKSKFSIPGRFIVGGKTYTSSALHNIKTGGIKSPANLKDEISPAVEVRKGVTVGANRRNVVTMPKNIPPVDVKPLEPIQAEPMQVVTNQSHAPNSVVRTGHNTFDVVSPAGVSSVAVSRAATGVGFSDVGKGTFITTNSRLNTLKNEPQTLGLNNIRISTRVIRDEKSEKQPKSVANKTTVHTAYKPSGNKLKKASSAIKSQGSSGTHARVVAVNEGSSSNQVPAVGTKTAKTIMPNGVETAVMSKSENNRFQGVEMHKLVPVERKTSASPAKNSVATAVISEDRNSVVKEINPTINIVSGNKATNAVMPSGIVTAIVSKSENNKSQSAEAHKPLYSEQKTTVSPVTSGVATAVISENGNSAAKEIKPTSNITPKNKTVNVVVPNGVATAVVSKPKKSKSQSAETHKPLYCEKKATVSPATSSVATAVIPKNENNALTEIKSTRNIAPKNKPANEVMPSGVATAVVSKPKNNKLQGEKMHSPLPVEKKGIVTPATKTQNLVIRKGTVPGAIIKPVNNSVKIAEVSNPFSSKIKTTAPSAASGVKTPIFSKSGNNPSLKLPGVAADGLREGAVALKNQTNKSDDMGTQTSGGVVQTTIVAGKVLKTAQRVSPNVIKAAVNHVPNTVIKTGKASFSVISAAGKSAVVLDRTIRGVGLGGVGIGTPIVLNTRLDVLKYQVGVTGLGKNAIAQKISRSAKTVQRGIRCAKRGAVSAYRVTKATPKVVKTAFNSVVKGTGTAITFSRGVIGGKVSISSVALAGLRVAKQRIPKLRLSKKVGTGGRAGAGKFAFTKGKPSAVSGIGKKAFSGAIGGVNALGNAFSKSDDSSVQGLGGAIKLGVRGTKTSLSAGRFTGRALKSSVRTSFNIGKGAVRGAMAAQKFGFGVAGKASFAGAKLLLTKAGGSVVSMAVGAVKALGIKAAPFVIIIVVIAIALNSMTAPIGAVGSIFGGGMSLAAFDGDGNEYFEDVDIREFIVDSDFGLPYLRSNFVNYIYNQRINENRFPVGNYHIVRYICEVSDAPTGYEFEYVDGSVMRLAMLADIIHPIFTAIVIVDYELAPTQEQALNILVRTFDYLFEVGDSTHIEWCGQEIATGEGYPLGQCGTCSNIHALYDCPNRREIMHTSHSGLDCCEFWCPGNCRPGMMDSYGRRGPPRGCPGRNCRHRCHGVYVCSSHYTMHVTLSSEGITGLLYVYFHSPINQLRNIANRTDVQDEMLATLVDMLELTMDLIQEMGILFGGGITMAELSHVEWVHGTRIGNQAIVDTALSWVGQQGGQPFWSFMGFGSRVPWCAAFVYFVFYQAGFCDIYPRNRVDANTASTVALVDFFRRAGQWQSNSFRNLAAGDVIFFDWTFNGQPNHVGIVVGRCEVYVYFVDGNWGDAVVLQSMRLDNPNILGYAILCLETLEE